VVYNERSDIGRRHVVKDEEYLQENYPKASNTKGNFRGNKFHST